MSAPHRFLMTGLLAIAPAWVLARPDAPVAELEGARFARVVERDPALLDLRGVALMRYAWVFKVYVAGLYLEEGAPTARVLDDVPRRLEIEYLRGFEADDFARSTRHFVRRNVGEARYAELEDGVESFNRLYRAVEPGDRYAMTYVPGRGTELALNGEVLGAAPGAALSRALFSIWFGDEPFDPALKRALLESR